MLSLTLTLRAIAIFLLLLIAFGYLNSGELQIKQFIAANVLFFLSIFSAISEKRMAVISLVLAIIIAVGAIQSFLAGESTIVLVVVNVIIFGYLALVSILTFKRQ